MRLFLIRHGETPWSAAKRYQGRSDVPLNAAGKKQARLLAETLKPEKPARLYTSNLRRALETARIIASRLKLDPIADPRLNEIDFGIWEGACYEQLSRECRGAYRRWRAGTLRRPPGGESIEDLSRRVGHFFREVLKQHAEDTVAVVAHGGPIKMFLLKVLGAERASIWSLRIDLASISLIQGNENLFQVTWMNQTHHLNSR